MPIRLRLASAVVVAAVGFTIPILVTKPAAADPCSVAMSAQARPPGVAPTPNPPVQHVPIGRKPGNPHAWAAPPQTAIVTPQAAVVPPGPTPTPQPTVPPLRALSPQPPTPQPAAAAVAASPATTVGWVDGPYSPNNTMTRFDISGADLGIMWDNGQSGLNDQVLIAFGDTYGNCSVAGQEWRENTLFRSADRNLSDGISVPDPQFGNIYAGSPVTADRPNFSKQIIASLGLAATEASVIPTAGIAVGTTQYVNFMSVRQWGQPGSWSTNFSAIAVSTDNGENWTVPQSSIRASFYFSVPGVWFNFGDQNFQQAAYVRNNGYVYSLGTASGRGGVAYIARVAENSITDLTQYEYYTLFGWLRGAQFFALPVIWDATSEMSVSWNDYLNKFIVLYTNAFNDVVMRTADNPEGPWSSTTTLVSSAATSGGIYAPYIHPWSSGHDLYFNLSLWSTYAVMMMHTTLP